MYTYVRKNLSHIIGMCLQPNRRVVYDEENKYRKFYDFVYFNKDYLISGNLLGRICGNNGDLFLQFRQQNEI